MSYEVHPDIQSIIDTDDDVERFIAVLNLMGRGDTSFKKIINDLMDIIAEQQKLMRKIESDHEDAISILMEIKEPR
jgi:hypothetical protein